MTKLTHFQEIVAMALDIDDQQAAKVQKAWPETEDELRKILRQWKAITRSSIKGYELLSAIGEIWRCRPDDLAETEGRSILYHPVNGNPIPKNSPLDGLSWEMLAFLHWSIQKGTLNWIDDVIMSREIKEAGDIEALPADRYYGKNSLPRTIDGDIDWSELALAQAKAFVTTGKQAVPSDFGPEPISYYDEDSLEGVLASIPALSNQGTRNLLLRGLPPGPVGAISRSSAPSTDLANIIEAAKGFGKLSNGQMGINVVIKNAIRFVKDTKLEAKLKAFEV